VYPPGYPFASGEARGVRNEGPAPAPPPVERVEIEPVAPPDEVRAAARAITRENRRAAALSPSEAREMLTMRVSELLQGGRAAILTPERRARAIRIARMLGVRDFDAHLVIAVVQDRARRGEIDLGASGSADADARYPFGMNSTVAALQFAAAVLLAAALVLGAVNWLG